MPARVSESFVLRTYPFREADLVVSFFSRDWGKMRGIARRARRPKSAFGSGLERLSRVRMAYFQKENAELASLSGCELIESQFALQSDYAVSMALDYFTEVTEQLMPSHEPNERYFRLLASVLAYLREVPDTGDPGDVRSADDIEVTRHARMWTAISYVSIWAVRLAGVWPDFRVSHESVQIAEEMFVTPIADLRPREWTKATASDLRRLLIRTMEQHAERRFMTVPLLEAL
jgi:DNA repair protein RecO (recombination protein O)